MLLPALLEQWGEIKEVADDGALEASRSKHEGDYMLLQKVVALFSKSKRGEIEARLAFKKDYS